MIDKIVPDLAGALSGIGDGATILVGGFGETGVPFALLEGVAQSGVRDLVLVSNNSGVADKGVSQLLQLGRVRKIICSYPRSAGSVVFDQVYARGNLELELVPQGTLTERIRAGGAGIGGFFTRTGVGTELTRGRETRVIDGQTYVLEHPLHGDVALIKGELGDRWGNLTYRLSARNFGPVMAPAATLTIAQVRHIVDLGSIDPEHVITPGLFVNRVWACDE